MVLSFYPKHEKEYQSMTEKEMMKQMKTCLVSGKSLPKKRSQRLNWQIL